MNWYHSILKIVNTADIPLDTAKRFYVFLQRNESSPKTKVAKGYFKNATNKKFKNRSRFFFHGTNSAVFSKIQDYGLMKSPENALAWQGEARPGTQQVLFFSQDKATSDSYASTRTGQIGEQLFPVTLALKIPLYAIAEVRNAIFRPYIPHPYQPNESGFNVSLSCLIQPKLTNIQETLSKITSSKQRKKTEHTMFSELLDLINDFFDRNAGEFTVTHGVPLRFMQEIYFPQTVLGCKNYTELNKKLEISEIARNEFLQNISKQPSLFSVLSPHQKNYKEAKIEAAKAWFKILKSNNTNIFWIPDSLISPTKDANFLFDTPKGKRSIYSYINEEIIPSMSKIGAACSNYYQFQNWLASVPKILHTHNKISPIIKDKLLKYGPGFADQAAVICSFISPRFWADNSFLNEIIEKIWSKVSHETLEKLWRTEYSEVSYDNLPLQKRLAFHPKPSAFYFSKIDIAKVNWYRFSHEIITPFADLIKERISNLNMSPNSLLNTFKESTMKGLPTFVLPSGFKEKLTKAYNEIINFENSLIYNINQICDAPLFMRNNNDLISLILEKIKTNPPKEITHYVKLESSWPSLQKFPIFVESKNELALLKYGINQINYESLTEAQKVKYYEKCIVTLKQNSEYFDYIHPSLKTDDTLIKAAMEFILKQVKLKNLYVFIPKEISNNPKYADFTTKVLIQKIENSGVLTVKYINIKHLPEVVTVYKEKLIKEIIRNADMVYYIHEELFDDDNFIEAVISSVVKYICSNNKTSLYIEKFLKHEKNVSKLPSISKKLIEGDSTLIINGTFDQIEEEYKTKYIKNICNKLKTNLNLINTIPDSIKTNPEIVKSIAEGYAYSVKYGTFTGIPDDIKSSEEFKNNHSYINTLLLNNNNINGLFTDSLTDEHKEKYVKILSNIVSVNPCVNISDEFLTHPLIIQPLQKGILYYITLGHISNVSKLIDKVNQLPEYTNFNTEIEKVAIKSYEAIANSYPVKGLKIIPAATIEKYPNILNAICNQLENGLFFGCITYGQKAQEKEIKEIIAGKFSPENDFKIMKAVEKGHNTIYTNHYFTFPSELDILNQADKEKFVPKIIEKFINTITSSNNFNTQATYFSKGYKVFSDNPLWKEKENSVIESISINAQKLNKADKNYYLSYHKNTKPLYDLLNSLLNADKSIVDKVKLNLSEPKVTGTHIIKASNEYKAWLEINPNKANTDEATLSKKMIINAFAEKIHNSKTLKTKKSWENTVFNSFGKEDDIKALYEAAKLELSKGKSHS